MIGSPITATLVLVALGGVGWGLVENRSANQLSDQLTAERALVAAQAHQIAAQQAQIELAQDAARIAAEARLAAEERARDAQAIIAAIEDAPDAQDAASDASLRALRLLRETRSRDGDAADSLLDPR
ncbi:hypothetical protein JANAI62_03600 [Jannaschia pagri]|uniref:Uncharacterized protein n=1 Tax=Jannaschia pagri TaxID=2829797 RepID=A0ABQ4NH47_9RHOB|nr:MULTISPECIES: hypothetical protein [unclassified Jannaschia]GIT90157.1 hypothetical protein JANAI61_06150 [Jannaschia sp. AI_61]GIT93737.1 hypothetical protein JANAI62_03600 [Jannaschia sp. AI_62]